MRPAAYVLLACALGACGTARPVVPEPPPRIVLPPAQPAPVAAAPLPTPPPAPPVQPPVPRESIERRSAYPGPGLVEWELRNGLRVVLLASSEAAGPPTVLAVAPGGYASLSDSAAGAAVWSAARAVPSGVDATLTATERRVETDGSPETAFGRLAVSFSGREGGGLALPYAGAFLDGAVPADGASASSGPSVFADAPAFTVAVVGRVDPDEVEAWAGSVLAPMPSRAAVTASGRPSLARLPEAPIVWRWAGGPPALDVVFRARLDDGVDPVAYDLLAEALRGAAGFGRVSAHVSPETRTVDLHVRSDAPPRPPREALDDLIEATARLHSVSDAALSTARQRLDITTEAGRAVRARWIVDVFQRGLDPRDITRREDALARVSAQTLRRLASAVLTPDRYAAVIGGTD